MTNLEKLDEAIAYIEAHPEEHSQGSWFYRGSCGTTACLAGTVALQAGYVPDWSRDYVSAQFVIKGAERRYTPLVAAEILGLEADDADALFLGANDLEEIKAIRDAIAAGKPGWSALPDPAPTGGTDG